MAERVLRDERIYPGDVARFTISVVDPDDGETAIDPAALVVKVLEPGATTATTYTYGTDAEIVRSDTGEYYIDIDLDDDGDWFVRMESTIPTDADEYHVLVQPSVFPA